MKNLNKLSSIAASALLAGGLTLNTANACEDLGSASELRSELITINSSDISMDLTSFKMEEGKCGEGKCGEGKCGEGKCGEKEEGEKKEGEEEKEEKEEKGEEGKCGEGSCGNL